MVKSIIFDGCNAYCYVFDCNLNLLFRLRTKMPLTAKFPPENMTNTTLTAVLIRHCTTVLLWAGNVYGQWTSGMVIIRRLRKKSVDRLRVKKFTVALSSICYGSVNF